MAELFTHRTVLLAEAVEGLKVKPDGTYVDCTYGRGGHSRLILSQLGPTGRLIAFDRDPAAVADANTISDPRFTIVHSGFSGFAEAMDALGVDQVDGVLMDLGISSPQIDDGARGFSFRFDAPLDMRMDTTRGQTAADWLAVAEKADIAKSGLLNRLQARLLRLGRSTLSAQRDNLPRSWQRPSAPGSRARTRRRAPSRLYGFSSIVSLRNCR
jgi:16S rRNA (cytosine1402-N4)-methyltransferase